MTREERKKIIEGLEIIQEQYLEKIQKQYREVKDTKEVSLFEWEILDRAIKELKKETVSKQSYDHEYLLRKTFETRIYELERLIETLEQQEKTKEI